jgi:hypothetical protein
MASRPSSQFFSAPEAHGFSRGRKALIWGCVGPNTAAPPLRASMKVGRVGTVLHFALTGLRPPVA